MGLLTSNINSFNFESITQSNTTNDLILNDTGRVVSIVGPSLKGKAFIPQGFNIYSGSNGQSFIEKIGDIYTHYKEYQTRINPILASYITLQSNAQVNYIRPLGINDSLFQFKPGFKIGQDNKTNKIYAFGFICDKKVDADLTRYNYDLLTTGSNYLLAGFIVSAKNVEISSGTLDLIDIGNNNKKAFKFELNLSSSITGSFNNTINIAPNDNDRIFEGDNKPNSKIYFNFDRKDEYYWKNILNSNIERLDELGYAFINSYNVQEEFDDIFKDVQTPTYFLKELTDLNYKDFEKPYQNAMSPWFVSQGYYQYSEKNKRTNEYSLKDRVKKLFRFHSVIDGDYGNNFLISIIPRSSGDSDLWAKFDIEIYDKYQKKIVDTIPDINLDINSENYICRLIGNKQEIFDINGTKRITTIGEYPLQNRYIWVEVSEEVEKGLIPKNTLPCGFIEKKKLKNFNISNNNNTINTINYVNQPYLSMSDITPDYSINNITIKDNHNWGRIKFKLKDKGTINLNSFKTNNNIDSSNDIFINSYEYLDDIQVNNTNNYMTDFFYQYINNSNLTNEDIFHLEKISLINQINETGLQSIRYDLSKYIHSGIDLYSLRNTKFDAELFNSGSYAEDSYPFYYMTINNNQPEINGKRDIFDQINNPNFFRFTSEMSDGWNGFNIFDIEQKTLTNKGIENNPYIKELIKYSMDIAISKENGLNNIIYSPGIYDLDIIKYTMNSIENDEKFKSMYIIDIPMYDSSSNIICTHDLIKRKLPNDTNNNILKWSDHVYEYNSVISGSIDELENINRWRINYDNINNKNIIGFCNYVYLTMNPEFANFVYMSDVVIPAGLIGLKYILDSNNITNITNLENGIGKFNNDLLISNIFPRFDESSTIWETQINPMVKKLKTNIVIKKNVNNSTIYGFNTSRTMQFSDNSNNQSLSNLMLYRLIMNEVKRILENYINRNLIFVTIKSKNEMLIRYRNQINTVMNNIVASGIITDYSLRLDDITTSAEDLLNNIVKMEVELQFPGQNNIITNKKINATETIKI